jgi:hypothetical protein
MESNEIVARVHAIMGWFAAITAPLALLAGVGMLFGRDPALGIFACFFGVMAAGMAVLHFWCRKGALALNDTARTVSLVIGVLLLASCSLASIAGGFLVYHSMGPWLRNAQARGRLSNADLAAAFPTTRPEAPPTPTVDAGDRPA